MATNKYKLRDYLETVFTECKSTFHETSYDDCNNEYLCNNTITQPVYDFDNYVLKNCTDCLPASPDAIYVGRKDLYFVEFKNQHISDINSSQIKKKFSEGTKILKEILQDFMPKDCNYYFCVVVRDAPKPRLFDSNYFERSGIRFGLKEINDEEGQFYNQIYTETVDFFKSTFALDC